MVRKSWQQEQEVASHIASAVRNQEDECLYSAHCLWCKMPNHGMALLVFRLLFPSLLIQSRNSLTDSQELCLQSESRLYEVYRQCYSSRQGCIIFIGIHNQLAQEKDYTCSPESFVGK